MMRLAHIALAMLFPTLGLAQDLSEKRPDFMASCNQQGTEERYCACFFDNWAADIPPEDAPAAIIAVDLFAGLPPENPAEVAQAARAFESLQTTIFACASGELVALDDTPDLPSIPQTGDQAELDQLAARLQSGQGTMDEMFRHDALALELRDQARAEQAAAEAAREARAAENRTALQTAYNDELDRIHSRAIESWELDDFEELNDLYCQVEGGRPEECACGWPITLRWAKERQNYLYLASRGPGDDVTDHVSLAIVQAITQFAIPSMRDEIADQCHVD